MELSPVNERIKIFWRYTGMRQHVLAEKIGCKQQDISSAVNNKYKPKLEIITGILVEFPNVSSEWLLFGKGKMMKSEASEYLQSEESLKTDEPVVKLFNCTDCIEKEKRIEDLSKEVKKGEYTIDLQRERIDSLKEQVNALRFQLQDIGGKSSDTNLKTNTA